MYQDKSKLFVGKRKCEKEMKEKLLLIADATYSGEKIKIEPTDSQEFLMGWIIMNRCSSIAYKNLDLETIHRDNLMALNVLKSSDEKRAKIFQKNLFSISKLLETVDFNYSFLKGAFLSTALYKLGDRTSKDFDILIESKNVSALQKILLADGFVQGWPGADDQSIIAATRRQIIESRMNFGETVPFIKIVDGVPVSVDVNFSVDFKPDEGVGLVPKLLNNVEEVSGEGFEFKSLSKVDFLIHLCCHLYKEATTYDWVKSRRDLDIYKFSDINVFLQKFGGADFFENLAQHIKEYGIEKECYYTFKNASMIFPKINDIENFGKCLIEIEPENLDYMKEIIYPREKKMYYYNESFLDWLMSNDRTSLLKEKIQHD